MDKKLFGRLVESMKQMGEISRGERAPSRKFYVDASSVKALRARTGLSQAKFAALLNVEVGTLRNWEQGRREPTGPAKALLYAINKDPRGVLRALAPEPPTSNAAPKRRLRLLSATAGKIGSGGRT